MLPPRVSCRHTHTGLLRGRPGALRGGSCRPQVQEMRGKWAQGCLGAWDGLPSWFMQPSHHSAVIALVCSSLPATTEENLQQEEGAEPGAAPPKKRRRKKQRVKA